MIIYYHALCKIESYVRVKTEALLNVEQRTFDRLAGVTESEEKRKIIGREFTLVFEEEVKKIGSADFLAHGTIYTDVIESALDRSIGQYFTALRNMWSVGCMGDERTYDYTIALRAVTTTDFMIAGFGELSCELLDKVSNRIVYEVKRKATGYN